MVRVISMIFYLATLAFAFMASTAAYLKRDDTDIPPGSVYFFDRPDCSSSTTKIINGTRVDVGPSLTNFTQNPCDGTCYLLRPQGVPSYIISSIKIYDPKNLTACYVWLNDEGCGPAGSETFFVQNGKNSSSGACFPLDDKYTGPGTKGPYMQCYYGTC